MIAKICQMTNKHFSPLMIVLVIIGILANSVLFYKNENLKAELQARTTEIALTQADNRNLANQLEHSHIRLEVYQKQVDDLNKKILAKMKQAEQRSNEILNELEKHKTWADSAVPSPISRLLNERSYTLSDNPAHTADLPEKDRLPNASNQHHNQRRPSQNLR